MKRIVLPTLLVLVILLNGFLLIENIGLKSALKIAVTQPAYIAVSDGQEADLRGVYTYPAIGRHFLLHATDDAPNSSLTLAIFLSARTDCPAVLSEIEVLKVISDSMVSRGQQVVAVTEPPDSARIAFVLDSAGLNVPLHVFSQDLGVSLYQAGISWVFMPFKVVFDSSYTAIYARGADNTTESQDQFARVVLKLSELAAGGHI